MIWLMLLLLAYLFVYSYVAVPRPAFGNDNTYSFFNRYYLLLFGLLAYRDCGKADVSIHLFKDPVGFKPVLFRLSLHQQLYATKEILKATQRPSKIMKQGWISKLNLLSRGVWIQWNAFTHRATLHIIILYKSLIWFIYFHSS